MQMGIKAIDLNPIASYGPTAVTPASKDVVAKFFTISRTDTTPSVKCVIPADASIISIRLYSPQVSNAGTTALIYVGIPGSQGYFVNGGDVKTNAGQLGVGGSTQNIFQLENTPLGADIQITGTYAETGTPSTSGGPFYITIEYVR
jgi:hypothetical protein